MSGVDSDNLSLVADIGATNARFALISDADGAQRGKLVLPTADHEDAGSLLDVAVTRLDARGLRRSCMAVAGPVVDAVGTITNGGMVFDQAQLSAALGCEVELVNDFHALALAIPHLSRCRQIGGATPAVALKAVLGPGSGLGMGMLQPEAEGGWRVLASEGGHADLPASNHLELEILGVLHQKLPHVCWESVLSGPGLVNLYEAVSAVWGSQPRELSAKEISAAGVDAADPVCHQTLELFFGWLGAAAGNLAITVCARGGVYIGGGIVPALAEFAASSALRRRFEERGELEGFVRDIPLYVILDEDPGLIGAWVCLKEEEGR